MPAIEAEIEDALKEQVTFEFLAAPKAVIRPKANCWIQRRGCRFSLFVSASLRFSACVMDARSSAFF